MKKTELRMSGAGKCPRALSAELLGCPCEPFPKWLEETAEEGKWHEERIIDELEQGKIAIPIYGKIIVLAVSRQQEQRLEYDSFVLTGHIEGKAIYADLPSWLLEIKSMSRFEFARWMKEGFVGFPKYLDQITCYFEATGHEECLYIVKNRDTGYRDVRIIKKLDNYFETIILRLTGVVESVAKGELYPAEFRSDSIECRRCRYKLLCIPKITAMDKATRQELDMAVAEVRDGNKLIAEGEELLKKGKYKLKKHTIASDLKKWQHNDLAMLLVNVKKQFTYPKENLLKEYSTEELATVEKVKEAYSYLKLEDLEKENG